MHRVLITGAAGFIGSHLCDELVAHGYSVCGLDNLDPQVHGPNADPPAYLNPAVEFIQGDVTYHVDVRQALRDVDAIVHLAANVGVAQSMYKLTEYIWTNSYGTALLLGNLQASSVKRLVVASSMSIYGEGNYGVNGEPIPTKESSPPDLQSVYALTKYDQERMCLLFGKAYHVPTIALRFFNVYGTRQSLNNPYTGAMAIFASRLLNGKPPIIYEDGQQRRDFVNVKDVARAVRLALESDVSDEVINIGSGYSRTILEVALVLADALGVNIKPEVTGQHRVGDIRHCFADISKARRLLGYDAQIAFPDGVKELVEWLKTQTAIDRVEQHRDELVEKGLLV
jgi:dTDP-L-rhamnose 4-epimerase